MGPQMTGGRDRLEKFRRQNLLMGLQQVMTDVSLTLVAGLELEPRRRGAGLWGRGRDLGDIWGIS